MTTGTKEFAFQEFQGMPSGMDVYNPSAPFIFNNKKYIAVRVESRDSELDSRSMFFIQTDDDVWTLDRHAPVFNLQDPFISRIGSDFLFGGVKISYKDGTCDGLDKEKRYDNDRMNLRTVFYKGDSLNALSYFMAGPEGMKDIRLVDLGGRVGVLTRPQGEKGGKGKIGYTECQSLEEVAILDMNNVPLLNDIFGDSFWGGSNQVYVLGENTLGIIGHKANDQINTAKRYVAISFKMDRVERTIHSISELAESSDLPYCAGKRCPELDDVLFPGGILTSSLDDEFCDLYTGVGDVRVGRIRVRNPFR